MKKNGFVSTTVIYTFFILFLLLMIFIMNSYSSTRFLLDQYKIDIKETFADLDAADINLYYFVWSDYTKEYELVDEIPNDSNVYTLERYYCQKNSLISPKANTINQFEIKNISGKEKCYAYYRSKVILKIYISDEDGGNRTLVSSVPLNYDFKNASCKSGSGASVSFDNNTRKFKLNNPKNQSNVECEANFVKKKRNVSYNYFIKDVNGTVTYENPETGDITYYSHIDEIPKDVRIENQICKKTDGTVMEESIDYIIRLENGNIKGDFSADGSCDIYFENVTNSVDIVYMQESENGEAGYTTGKRYLKTSEIPTSGYKYIGSICDNNNISLKYENNEFTVEGNSSSYTICRAYFNTLSDVDVSYYMQTDDDKYESVVSIPELGYIYNKEKSSCKNNSNIIVDNNIATIDTTETDECDVYFDKVKENSGVKVNVYVDGELSTIPSDGYSLYSSNCTNGATIEIKRDKNKYSTFEVKTTGPTTCDVYFRRV